MNQPKEYNQFLASGKVEDYLMYKQDGGIYDNPHSQRGTDGFTVWEMKQ